MTIEDYETEIAFLETRLERVDPDEQPLYHAGLKAGIEHCQRKIRELHRASRRLDGPQRSYR